VNSTVKEKWEELHSQPRFWPQYPNESVVRFMFTNFPTDLEQRKPLKVLDIGCGGGRHVKLFAEQGFAVYGTDLSEEGIRQTQVMLVRHNLTAELMQCDMTKLPYGNNFFDGAVSFGVFYYSDSKKAKKAISELYRMLKDGGKTLINMRTTNDYRFGKGKQIEENTFILTISKTNEEGMPVHFLTEEAVYEYFSQFSRINLERYEYTYDNLKQLNSDWIITVEK
jgi:ubiquinone/menaquinone biosynthesis C-methylase UbiE